MTTELQTTETAKEPTVATESRNWRRPHYEVSENADSFNVRVSMPGVNRDGIDISLEEDTLTVSGSFQHPVPKTWRPLRREIPADDYRLTLRLNVHVNEAAIKARVENGILLLSLPKADEVKPHKIPVS